MQSLFYSLIGRSDDTTNTTTTNDKTITTTTNDTTTAEDFETLECPENQVIIQIHRKIKLMNELKMYIKKKGIIYYNYIIYTTIYEYENNRPVIYTLVPSIFGKLHKYRTSDNLDDYLKFFLDL